MIQNPRGEYMVLVNHTPQIFIPSSDGYTTFSIRSEVLNWLIEFIGLPELHSCLDVSAQTPWRERVWSLGPESQHCFFFHTKNQAILFKLVWA